ncbi:hypothetical protein GOB57_09215 [Sinorhizobium meliloti]|nr:hypothetical protein [Sinorhizobium meliloti]
MPLIVEGVEGEFHVRLEEGRVSVLAFFGSERWRQNTAEPVVVDNVRYSVALKAEPVDFSDFDLASTIGTLSFSMHNLDIRTSRFDFPTPVAKRDPVFATTRDSFVNAVSQYIQELAATYPGFSHGFRQAVATLEIARLRQAQELAWSEISERTRVIQRYMELVPEEMERVGTLKVSSQKTGTVPIKAGRDGLAIEATGVHSIKVQLAGGGASVISVLIDGTVRNDIIRP